MAGDWIKVEQATIDKPEIIRTADLLGISRREALGLYVEFWVWLDKNLSGSCPDFVRHMSKKSLDDMMRCAGFASCLEDIGWAEFDEKERVMRITNAERHNGSTAKSRALDAKRKKEKRSENVREVSGSQPDENRTREEKRREERESTPQRSQKASRLPKDWKLTTEQIEWAVGAHPGWKPEDVLRVAEVFRDYWTSAPGKQGVKQDWDATWRNWVRREHQHKPPKRDEFAGVI